MKTWYSKKVSAFQTESCNDLNFGIKWNCFLQVWEFLWSSEQGTTSRIPAFEKGQKRNKRWSGYFFLTSYFPFLPDIVAYPWPQYIHIYMQKHIQHNKDERRHFFRKIYLSLHLKGFERVTQGFTAWEVSWRLNRTATYWPPLLYP